MSLFDNLQLEYDLNEEFQDSDYEDVTDEFYYNDPDPIYDIEDIE